MRLLLITTVALCLISCTKKEAAKPVASIIETQINWKGASAEQIQELVISPIKKNIELAVIEDGQATLYHLATIEQTMVELEQIPNRPYGLMISPPKSIGNAIPKPPVVKQVKRIEWSANKAAIEKHGVSTNELLGYLKRLEFDPEDSGNKIASLKFNDIPLDDLVSYQIITIDRPLIIDPD